MTRFFVASTLMGGGGGGTGVLIFFILFLAGLISICEILFILIFNKNGHLTEPNGRNDAVIFEKYPCFPVSLDYLAGIV